MCSVSYDFKSDSIECGFSQVEDGVLTSRRVITNSRVQQHQMRKVELMLSTKNQCVVADPRVW